MKDSTCLKANVRDAEEALEIMDYLYRERIDHIGSFMADGKREIITWFETEDNNSCFAKWTKEYGNIMISQSFLERGRK